MLLDILNPANFMMINRNAVKIFGLVPAAYCAELAAIAAKAKAKNKLYNDKYFLVDREYIKKQTTIDIEDQLKFDINIAKVNVVQISEENPNMIYFDIETYASLLACEDIKLLDNVAKKVKVSNPKGTKKAEREYTIAALKNSFECHTPEILIAMNTWIDSIFENGKGMSKFQVRTFKDKVDNYCDGDLQKALKVIEIATIHSYIDCDWAINLYERHNKPVYNSNSNFNNFTKVTEQKVTTEISDEVF